MGVKPKSSWSFMLVQQLELLQRGAWRVFTAFTDGYLKLSNILDSELWGCVEAVVFSHKAGENILISDADVCLKREKKPRHYSPADTLSRTLFVFIVKYMIMMFVKTFQSVWVVTFSVNIQKTFCQLPIFIFWM